MDNPYLSVVRDTSMARLEALQKELSTARELIDQDGTIFATGSFGRLESGPESDLDVFVVSLAKGTDGEDSKTPIMDQVRQIRLKNELIVAVKKAGIADFDAGGKFLETHLFTDMVEEVGSPADDYKNTFTGRMLLILESRCLLGEAIYDDLKAQSINSYFGDYEGNEGRFVPYFLINDLLRMWRTFCVNYEFFRKGTSDWRVKNLKLKYTRMLTCYSAIIYVSAVYRLRQTVSPNDIEAMSAMTPIERLEQFHPGGQFADLGQQDSISEISQDAISDYGEFLEFVQEKKAAIKALKRDEEEWRERSHQFGGKIAKLIQTISGENGLENRLFRSILV